MSRFDPPATTRAKTFSGSQPVEGWRGDGFDHRRGGPHRQSGPPRGGSEMFSQCRSGSELVGRGSPVAGGVLGFGEVQARVLCSGRPRA
jgi:hypothetical protein